MNTVISEQKKLIFVTWLRFAKTVLEGMNAL
jgi:hypothetical protein